jgi:hypothetical protein
MIYLWSVRPNRRQLRLRDPAGMVKEYVSACLHRLHSGRAALNDAGHPSRPTTGRRDGSRLPSSSRCLMCANRMYRDPWKASLVSP